MSFELPAHDRMTFLPFNWKKCPRMGGSDMVCLPWLVLLCLSSGYELKLGGDSFPVVRPWFGSTQLDCFVCGTEE